MKRLFCVLFVVVVGCAGEIPHMQFTPAAKAPEVTAAPSEGIVRIEQRLESIETKLLDEPVKVSAPADDPTPLVEEPELPRLSLPEVITGKAGAFIKVSATTNGREVRWQALDDGLNVFPGEMLKDSKSTVVTGEAGEHRLMAYTALADVPSDPEVCIVRITGPPKPEPKPDPRPEPKPDPQPDPKPTPPPVVTTANLWVVVLDDWQRRTPDVTRILTDMQLRNELTTAGHKWRSLDASQTADVAKFAEQLNANGGMPCVVLMDPNGKWMNRDPTDMKLPLTQDGWRALIRKYTGK
jgi:hypothetical protein